MTQIKLRRDTSADFASKNPVLGLGEPAYETDTKKLKIGDGTTAYTQLEYFSAGGGGSTNITATLPLKIVDGVISLEVDGQTIQVVDGKLTASSTAPSNMVTTDTNQSITGVKKFTYSDHSFIINQIDGTIGIAPGNNAVNSSDSAQFGTNDTSTWFVGAKSKTGYIYANSLIRNNGSSNSPILDSSNLGSYVDGTTITYTNNKLTATGGGSSEPPANMVTTDTAQTITGHKSFSDELTINKIDGNYGLYISTHPLKGAIRFGNTERDVIIAGKGITTEAGDKFLTSGNVTAYVTEEFIDGTEGYRIWSNGRCEQWGYKSGTNEETITFLKAFEDTNYNVVMATEGSSRFFQGGYSNKTTTDMLISYTGDAGGSALGTSWMVTGNISKGGDAGAK